MQKKFARKYIVRKRKCMLLVKYAGRGQSFIDIMSWQSPSEYEKTRYGIGMSVVTLNTFLGITINDEGDDAKIQPLRI